MRNNNVKVEKEVEMEETKYFKTTTFYENVDFLVEHEQNVNSTINYESRSTNDGGCIVSSVETPNLDRVVNGSLTSDKINGARDLTYDEHTYENLTYEKELLLHKYFQSRKTIYENLCRGCGYGVFESRGELCYFCASIVNGVRNNTPGSNSTTDLNFASYNSNIYENICEKCFRIYSTDECEHCERENTIKLQKNSKHKNYSNDELNSKTESVVKVKKSKSFNKRNEKRGIFQGFFGSLKRSPKTAKTEKSTSVPKLEIIHNVDGFEHVFRTQETFDLQRICELKKAQHSNSEQHIYGRLKRADVTPEIQSASTQTLPLPKVEKLTSIEQFESFERQTPQLSKTESESSYLNSQTSSNFTGNSSEERIENKSGKRPRISKPRLLRAFTSATQHSFNGKTTKAAVPNSKEQQKSAPALVKQQSLYLADSVCNWMTSLRQEIWDYNDFYDGLCTPKSIPAKHAVIDFYAVNTIGATKNGLIAHTHPMTNFLCINDVTSYHKSRNSDVSNTASEDSSASNYDETVTLRSRRTKAQVFEFDQQTPVDCAQMVNEFMRNFLVKQESREMSQAKSTETGAKIVEKRDHNTKRHEQRAKRQAIYLKTHENENSNLHNDSRKSDEKETIEIKIESDQREQNVPNVSSDLFTNIETKENSSKCGFETELDSTAFSESPISRRRAVSAISGSDPQSNNRKRCGIYEIPNDTEFVGDILSAFDTYLQREEEAIEAAEVEQQSLVCEDTEQLNTATPPAAYRETEKGCAIDPSTDKSLSFVPSSSIVAQRDQQYEIYFIRLVEELHLTCSLNRIVISYRQPLHAFLNSVRERYPRVYNTWTQKRLIRKFKKFQIFCFEHQKSLEKSPKLDNSIHRREKSDSAYDKKPQNSETKTVFKNVSTKMSADAHADALNSERNSVKIIVQQVKIQGEIEVSDKSANEMVTTKANKNEEIEKKSTTTDTHIGNGVRSPATSGEAGKQLTNTEQKKQIPLKPHRVAPKRPEPPQVPQRDPKTALSTKAPVNLTKTESQPKIMISTAEKEESIYHPIWNFKTVGEVQERYQTDVDYYEIGVDNTTKTKNVINSTKFTPSNQQLNSLNAADTDSLASFIVSADNDVEEDHGEWETDDEFMFTTEMLSAKSTHSNVATDASSLNSSNAASSLSGSTVAGFSSSTATLASGISASLTHHLLRNVGIFYSLTEPKLRAIIYDYDRVHASAYFAKHLPVQQTQQTTQSSSKSISPCSQHSNESNADDSGIGKSPKAQRSPIPPPRTTSAAKGPNKHSSESGCHAVKAIATPTTPTTATATVTTPTTTTTKQQPQLLPDSVLAWKFMLLDVNYLEDEEDMIVSEIEILRAQEIKEDIDTRQTQQLNILQRFKSASFGNLVDLPNEDDKKSIAERMRNKLQRGVFKLRVPSPKSDKRNRGIFRRAEVTSLYLENGVDLKYPIFGVSLEKLELDQKNNPNVPRFVVDCVAYIERKDCIFQEGLYRASGNKVSVEELKHKLSESYIYDPKLLVADDIHTLTSLLKLFFRELGAPLIPQENYERLSRNLTDEAGIESIRQAFEDICEPNRSTLKFIIRHLTNVASCSSENRMPASNLAIVWGPCLLAANQIEFDIARMNTLAKVLIENYAQIFNESERFVA